MTAIEEKPGKARPGLIRRSAALCAASLSGLLLLVIILGAGAYLRLASGEISLNAYLPEITSRISERLPGARIEIASAAVALTEDGGARLVVNEARLIDDETGPFALVPRASGAFRVSDLATGVIDPSNVTLSGVEVKLVRADDGSFQFGFAGQEAEGEAEGVEAFRRLLVAATSEEAGPGAEADAAIPEARGQVLQLSDARIIYEDRRAGRAYESSDASLLFWRGVGAIYTNGALTFHPREAPDETTTLNINGRRLENGAFELSASVIGASPDHIAGQFRALDWLAAFDAPVDGDLRVSFTGDGVLTALSGGLSAGAGRIALGGGVTEAIAGAELSYAFEPENERFVIEKVAIRADRLSIDSSGFVQVNRDEAAEVSDVVAQLEFTDIHASAPEFLDKPIAYGEGRLTGRVTLYPLTVEIGELRLAEGSRRFNATGRIWREAGEWLADMAVSGSDFSIQQMLDHWPRQAAPGALVWMRENMTAARVIEADAIVRLGGDEREEVKIDFTFDGAEGAYLAPMPPIRDAVGAGQVDLQTFTLSLDAGNVSVGDAGVLDVAGSTFVIEDLNHPDTPGTATVFAKGPTKAALALLDTEPLKLVSALGAPLGEVGGDAEVKAVASFPLLKDLLLEDVKVSAEAKLTDVALIAPGLGERLTAKELAMAADTSAFTIGGDVVLSGMAANVEWEEVFSPASRRVDVRARVVPADLARFGFEQPWFTDGSALVRARVTPRANGARISIDADLARADLSVKEIVWSKPAGSSSKASLTADIGGAGTTLSGIEFESADLIFDGSAAIGAEGGLDRVALNRVRYRGAVDLGLEAVRNNRRWRVDVSGRRLDLGKLEDLTGGADDFASSGRKRRPYSFRVNYEIGELRVNEGQYFRTVKGFADQSRDGATTLRVNGDLQGGGRVRFEYMRDEQGKGSVRLRARDAGRFLRDAGIFDDGSGGDLLIRGDIGGGDAFAVNGRVVVRDLVIHDDAKLEQMLEGADLADLKQSMREDGIYFSSIRAPFRYADDRVVLSDAVAKSSSIGVNVSGAYHVGREEMDFDGVFTPLYALNSALGGIPLLGDILTGGKGQGLFAFNFAVRGNAKNPKVSVNPLSVLTPGIFRKILPAGSGGDADNVSSDFEEDDRENSRR